MRKNKSKKILKRFVISETQQHSLIKGCQESPLTVAEYAKAHKVAPSVYTAGLNLLVYL